MGTPIALICGGAGSGKDTVAAMLGKYVDCVSVAQADPLKRFGRLVFGFSDDQLWGPSESRNAEDHRFENPEKWKYARAELGHLPVSSWLRGVGLRDNAQALPALVGWFDSVAEAHGLHWDESYRRYVQSDRPRRSLTARYVLQTLGTEWGRRIEAGIWNRVALDTAFKLLGGRCLYTKERGLVEAGGPEDLPGPDSAESAEGPAFVAITDGRFRNEVLGVLRVGGVPIQVANPSPREVDAAGSAGVAGHRSETELRGVPRHWYRYRVLNDKSQGLGALENKVQRLAAHLVAGTGTLRDDFGQAG